MHYIYVNAGIAYFDEDGLLGINYTLILIPYFYALILYIKM